MNVWSIIYLLGFIPTYFMGRAAHKACGSWTVGERFFVILTCITSWAGFLIFLSTWLKDEKGIDIFNADKDANW